MKKIVNVLCLLMVIYASGTLCSSCTHTINDLGIVNSVENNWLKHGESNYHYVITVDVGDNMSTFNQIEIITNTLYQVGDTVKFYKIRPRR